MCSAVYAPFAAGIPDSLVEPHPLIKANLAPCIPYNQHYTAFDMDDAQQPATKADIRTLKEYFERMMDEFTGRMDEFTGSMDEFTGRMDGLDHKWERLYEADDQILAVLTNIEKRLTQKVDSHEHRITHLENLAGVASQNL